MVKFQDDRTTMLYFYQQVGIVFVFVFAVLLGLILVSGSW